MSNTFEILMDQLDMPLEMRIFQCLLHAWRFKKSVHKVSRVWEFRFAFAEVLPIALFKGIASALEGQIFKDGKPGDFYHSRANQDFSDDLLQAYYREVFEEGPLRESRI